MLCSKTSNGLNFAVEQEGQRVAYCALSIRCGTREEDVRECSRTKGGRFHSGTAHFVEHTLFKGTTGKSAGVINGYLEKLGGELNAYTTKEEIVLHSTVLKEDIEKAAGLLFELASRPTFPLREVETEKTVVIDEIASYKDSPADDIYDRFESLLFEGHPLSGNVLGTPSSVKKITPEELQSFVRTFFRPERMAFTVVSPLADGEAAKMVERLSLKYFGKAGEDAGKGACEVGAAGESEECAGGMTRDEENITTEERQTDITPDFEGRIFSKTVNRHSHQANCIIGATAPSLRREKERIATSVMVNILGGPATNSRLNSKLREKKGWVYNVECCYTQYADSGIVAVCFGCDRDKLEECIAAAGEEIERLQKVPLTPRSLKAAKKQLIGQLTVAAENGESQALAMGKSLLAFGKVQSDDYTRRVIEEVTSEDIQRAAREVFAPGRLSTLIYL